MQSWVLQWEPFQVDGSLSYVNKDTMAFPIDVPDLWYQFGSSLRRPQRPVSPRLKMLTPAPFLPITIQQIVEHLKLDELVDGDNVTGEDITWMRFAAACVRWVEVNTAKQILKCRMRQTVNYAKDNKVYFLRQVLEVEGADPPAPIS